MPIWYWWSGRETARIQTGWLRSRRIWGTRSFLIDKAEDIQTSWLEGIGKVAVTAGASAPEVLVQEVVSFLRERGYGDATEVEVMPENVRFGTAA